MNAKHSGQLPRSVQRALLERRDREASGILVASVWRYICRYAWRVLRLTDLSAQFFDDLVAEGAAGALRAIQLWDLIRDVDFLTFASAHIRDRMWKFTAREMRSGLVAVSAIDYPRDDPSPETLAQSTEALTAAARLLSARERIVLEHTLEGCELREIAVRLARWEGRTVSSNRIRQLQIRAREKARKALEVAK